MQGVRLGRGTFVPRTAPAPSPQRRRRHHHHHCHPCHQHCCHQHHHHHWQHQPPLDIIFIIIAGSSIVMFSPCSSIKVGWAKFCLQRRTHVICDSLVNYALGKTSYIVWSWLDWWKTLGRASLTTSLYYWVWEVFSGLLMASLPPCQPHNPHLQPLPQPPPSPIQENVFNRVKCTIWTRGFRKENQNSLFKF